MAPVLQCPDCGEKHPLPSVPTSGAFPCRGCGRVLKVPEVVGRRAAAVEPEPASAAVPEPEPVPTPVPVPVATAVARPGEETVDPAATRLVPQVDEQALGALSGKGRRPVARLGRVPWWMRLLLWIIAVPVSFLVVFLVARAFSFFTTNQLSDVFLANDTSRFWPVARLLPFVALLTASLVQGGVYLLARLRGRRSRGAGVGAGDLSVAAGRSRGR